MIDSVKEAKEVIFARGYLAALDGPEVKALVEALEGVLNMSCDGNSEEHSFCESGMIKTAQKALAKFREEVKP